MQKRTVKKILYWAVVTILIAVILVCVFLIAKKLIGDAQDKKDNENIAALKESAEANAPARPDIPDVPVTTGPEDETPDEPKEMLPQYQLMYNTNSDTVGWIEIPGTTIDYPVVQSPYEANFYLRRNFYKENATCGTIYVRERCDVFSPSDNVTMYGHNMRNGTMFADLHKYEDKSFWESNKYIYFDTLYDYHAYEIFAVFISSADLSNGENFRYHLFDNAADQAEFDEFVASCKELSLYDTGITPQYGEKLITLSTCDKSIEDGRFVVVARRIY